MDEVCITFWVDFSTRIRGMMNAHRAFANQSPESSLKLLCFGGDINPSISHDVSPPPASVFESHISA